MTTESLLLLQITKLVKKRFLFLSQKKTLTGDKSK